MSLEWRVLVFVVGSVLLVYVLARVICALSRRDRIRIDRYEVDAAEKRRKIRG